MKLIKLSELPNYSVWKMFKNELDEQIRLMERVYYPYVVGHTIKWFDECEMFVAESFNIDEDISADLYNTAIENAKADIIEVDNYLKSIGIKDNELVVFKLG